MTMADLRRVSAVMKDKDASFFRSLGERIAQARKEKGLTQATLAERLGVPQQTYAHYEVGRVRIAASMLPELADMFDVSVDELLTGEPAGRRPGKRGPASRLQQQVDAICLLPKAKQRVVSEVLDAMLAQHAS
jgi:transcriptional regulator with XRE-family HTH domain